MDAKTRTVITPLGQGLKVGFSRVRLLVEAGPDRGLELQLAERPVVIGRGEDADLRLSDSAASRRHAQVGPSGEGWKIKDLDSKAGTFVEGVKIDAAALEPGRRIRIGTTEIVLRVSPAELVAEPVADPVFEGLRGASPPMRRLFGLVRKLAALELPVLIRGESGTGKEGLARALHKLSPHGRGPYEVVDCTLLDREHLRSELFGHQKGAFTGADQARKGAFERADGGTIFLDEVGELPLDLQPQLLRVLEEGEVRPLGGAAPIKVRVRVVSATHQDLEDMVRTGRMRRDLYYRLAAVAIDVPPLRDRPGDVEVLADHFLPAHLSLDPAARERLRAYPWPGNVRELKHTLARAAGLAEGSRITPSDLGISSAPPGPRPVPGSVGEPAPLPDAPAGTMVEIEQKAIRDALERFQGNRKAAAEHLRIGRSTLYRKLKEMGID